MLRAHGAVDGRCADRARHAVGRSGGCTFLFRLHDDGETQMRAKADCQNHHRTGHRCMTLLAATTLSLVCCALIPSASHAQSIDYGSLEQLFGESVTTSATGSPQRVTEVPANMEIITADEIRRSGADNIPDILQFIAGVDVRRYSFAQAEVSVRG